MSNQTASPLQRVLNALLDRIVAAELRAAEISRDRAEIAAELEDLRESHNELDERNTDLHIRLAAAEKGKAGIEELRARVAELSVAGHVEVFCHYNGGVARLNVNSVSSSNGKTTIDAQWPRTT